MIVGRATLRRLLVVAGVVVAHGLAILALQHDSAQPRPRGAPPPTSLRVTLMPAELPALPKPPPVVAAAPATSSEAPAPPAAPVMPAAPDAAAPDAAPSPAAGPPPADAGSSVAVVDEPAPAAAGPDAPSRPIPPMPSASSVPAPPPPGAKEPERPLAPAAQPEPVAGAAAAPVTPWPAPPSVARRFRIFYGDYREGQAVAELAYSLEIAEGRYLLKAEARATGLTALFWSGALTQRSSGRIGPAGLEPDRYVEQRGRRPERWASIDRGAAMASFSGGEQVPLVPGTQDRLSALVQLGLIARVQPRRIAIGQQIALPELGNRAIAPVRYASLGDEVLSIADAELRALHLRRRDGEAGRETTVDIWLGYDQDLMPVRIRLTDPGGRVLDQVLAP